MGPLISPAGEVKGLLYTLDGSRIVSSTNNRYITTWNASDGMKLFESRVHHPELVQSISLHPSGSTFVSVACKKFITIHDVKSLRPIQSKLRMHSNAVNLMQYSHCGSFILCTPQRQTLRILDSKRGSTMGEPEFCGDLRAVASSPDGSWVVGGDSEGTITIWCVRDS